MVLYIIIYIFFSRDKLKVLNFNKMHNNFTSKTFSVSRIQEVQKCLSIFVFKSGTIMQTEIIKRPQYFLRWLDLRVMSIYFCCEEMATALGQMRKLPTTKVSLELGFKINLRQSGWNVVSKRIGMHTLNEIANLWRCWFAAPASK